MPRASKRKADPQNPSSVTSAPDSRTASGKSKLKGTKLIDSLFDTYANSSSGVIEPEGIEALCSDIGVEHTDVRILMLAWKLKAQRQGYFTQVSNMVGIILSLFYMVIPYSLVHCMAMIYFGGSMIAPRVESR